MSMKIAMILPSLANQGPVIVARDIIRNIKDPELNFEVFYFDELLELEFDCPTTRIAFSSPINFDAFDIIHSHMLRPDAYVWRYRKQIKYARCMSTLHQDIFQNLKASYNAVIAGVFTKLWLLMLRRQDAIVTLSETMASMYRSALKGKHLETIYNGRDQRSFAPQPVDAEDVECIALLKRSYKLIGSLALLTKRKGLHQMIKALPLLPEFAFMVVGDGKEMFNLKKLATEHNVADRCLFIGYRADAYRYLPDLDYFLMASYSEGFPLGLLEAAQYKLPLICTDIPLFRELFSETEVSFFKPDDTQALVQAVNHAVVHKDVLATKASEKVKREYNIERMAERYLLCYHRLIKRND